MLRSILSIVVGYFAMAAFVMLGLFAPARFLPELVFQRDALAVTPAFLAYSLVMGFVAAMLGGFVAAVIAGKTARWPVKALAGLVLVLGLALAIGGLFQPEANVSAEEVARMSVQERMPLQRQPTWYAFLLPFLGSGGVMAGGWLRRRAAVSKPSDA